MGFRLMLGIDPGTTGALAVFVDGELRHVGRLPVIKRKATATRKGGTELDTPALADWLRQIVRDHVGLTHTAVLEDVGGFTPAASGKAGANAVTTAKLARIAGKIEGVLVTLGFTVHTIAPRLWKAHHGLKGADKVPALALAKRRYPWLVLETKASADLAEAVLIGEYGVAKHGKC